MIALTAADKQTLLSLARQALTAALTGAEYIPPVQTAPALQEKCGCFVTLTTNGHLRGCLGCFVSSDPVWQSVPAYARHSALEDPRFFHNRLTAQDLDSVHIEVSVLSPLAPCADPLGITPGVHGIYVRQGGRSGCFLPQVQTQTGWSLEEFWSHCCADKAGLPHDVWRTGGAQLYVFTADVFPAE